MSVCFSKNVGGKKSSHSCDCTRGHASPRGFDSSSFLSFTLSFSIISIYKTLIDGSLYEWRMIEDEEWIMSS